MANAPAKVEKVEGAALAVITATEIDRQVATAHQFPRKKADALVELRELVTSSEEVALACFYTLEREETDKATGKKVPKFIVGPSVRFAEILVYCWGNLRVATRIVDEGAEFLTAQGIAHDLERNNAVSVEIRRRITTSKGHRYGTDMIGVTGAAAASIAFRNAVFDLIPRAVWNAQYEAARTRAVGDKTTIGERLRKAVETFVKAGATEAHIYPALGVETVADMTADHLIMLAGLWKRVLDKEIEAAKIFHPEHAQEREKIGMLAHEPAEDPADGSRAKSAGGTQQPAAGKQSGTIEDKPAGKGADSQAKPADQVEDKKPADPPKEEKKTDAEILAEGAETLEAVRLDLELVARVEAEVAAAGRGNKLKPILEARGALRLISETSPSPDAKARALAILDKFELPPEQGN